MDIEIRTALPDDKGPLAELMYSAGPELYDYIYKKRVIDYLRSEFRSGQGFAGYPIVTVALIDGEVVGTGCFYGDNHYKALLSGSMAATKAYFGPIGSIPVFARSRHLGSVVKKPKPGELYLSNFGVQPHLRGKGIGTKLIQHRLKQAREEGYSVFGLDVSKHNLKGQALYQRLGLRIVKEKTFAQKKAGVPNALKMELTL